jgi:anti-repressor protein
VDARQLHAFLESKKDFSTWIKDRIEQYGFIEGEDFISNLLPNFGGKGQGRPTKEYYLTIDVAKEISMVERNAKGKQARQYFIECERKTKEILQPMSSLQMISHMALVLDGQEK